MRLIPLCLLVPVMAAAGCGKDSAPAAPKFTTPPKSQLGEVQAGSGTGSASGGSLTGAPGK